MKTASAIVVTVLFLSAMAGSADAGQFYDKTSNICWSSGVPAILVIETHQVHTLIGPTLGPSEKVTGQVSIFDWDPVKEQWLYVTTLFLSEGLTAAAGAKIEIASAIGRYISASSKGECQKSVSVLQIQ